MNTPQRHPERPAPPLPDERDDSRFVGRVGAILLPGSLPVWGALLIAFLAGGSFRAYAIALAVTLPIPLALAALRLCWARCPACGRNIRVNWADEDYRRGGELKYACPACRIVWNTHIRPGSSVS